MIREHDKFRNILSGVQSLVVSMAVIVGGIWTLITFSVLGEVGKARAERSEIEKRLHEQAQIVIQIQASHHLVENDKHCIAATVAITNTGERNVFLDYGDPPFSVAQVTFDAQGKSHFKTALTQPNLLSRSRVLRSGETVNYPFFVVVENTGMYVVQFRVPLPPDELPEHLGAGGPKGKISWVGSTYVNIAPLMNVN